MTALAINERAHIHDEIAELLGIDPDTLRAEIADQIREPLRVGGES